ncbi:glycosyl hydrolase family 18 protein, partial [Planctomycetota bacterium]
CVGYYPPMYKDKLVFWYDPKVIGRTCDMIRVMCYDMYYAPGIADPDPEYLDRTDVHGLGPTSTIPWARDAMKFWLKYVPRKKLIMGLPAYSNDYDMTPGGGGKQVDGPRPTVSAGAKVERIWLPYEKINTYRYIDEKGRPHWFFASDEVSTAAHLKTVDKLNIPGIAFWTYQDVTPQTWKVVRKWLKK